MDSKFVQLRSLVFFVRACLSSAQVCLSLEQVRIFTALLTFSLLLGKIPLCRPKIIPIRRDISM